MMEVLKDDLEGPLIVGMPGVSGGSFGFRRLIDSVEFSCTAVSFEDPHLHGGPSLGSVSQIAEYFADRLISWTPDISRPTIILGYSFGSRLAAEMTQHLENWPEITLMLVGAGRTSYDWDVEDLDDAALFHGYFDIAEDLVRKMEPNAQHEYILRNYCARIDFRIDGPESYELAQTRMNVFRKNAMAMASYTLPKLDRAGTIVESQEEDNLSAIFEDWKSRLPSMRAEVVPGGHTTMFTYGPYVSNIARIAGMIYK